MNHTINGENVVFNDGAISYVIGTVSKVETYRMDNENVADITFQFDLEKGDYTEVSRITRTDVLVIPPTIEQQVSDLQDVVNAILMGGL